MFPCTDRRPRVSDSDQRISGRFDYHIDVIGCNEHKAVIGELRGRGSLAPPSQQCGTCCDKERIVRVGETIPEALLEKARCVVGLMQNRMRGESTFPGGISHACELETSLYLYLDEDGVRKDQIRNHISTLNDGNPYLWTDLFSRGPAALTSWTSTYTPRGVMGEPEFATREKGRLRRSRQTVVRTGGVFFAIVRPILGNSIRAASQRCPSRGDSSTHIHDGRAQQGSI